jgi:hypothetical protein
LAKREVMIITEKYTMPQVESGMPKKLEYLLLSTASHPPVKSQGTVKLKAFATLK